MGSEISPLREKEWKARRDRIGAAAIDVANFMVKRTIDILPDLYAIKVKKLYELGGYHSFTEFLRKCAGVSPQHYWRMITDHPEACKVLEISKESSHNEMFGALGQSTGAPQKEEQKTTIEPPKEKKRRKKKSEPEPVDATFTEATPTEPTAPLRGITPTLLTGSDGDPMADQLPDTILAESIRTTTESILDRAYPIFGDRHQAIGFVMDAIQTTIQKWRLAC